MPDNKILLAVTAGLCGLGFGLVFGIIYYGNMIDI